MPQALQVYSHIFGRLLRHILDYLKEELSLALQDGGVDTFIRMYDNGKKHIKAFPTSL